MEYKGELRRVEGDGALAAKRGEECLNGVELTVFILRPPLSRSLSLFRLMRAAGLWRAMS